jgi:hypothetical protein
MLRLSRGALPSARASGGRRQIMRIPAVITEATAIWSSPESAWFHRDFLLFRCADVSLLQAVAARCLRVVGSDKGVHVHRMRGGHVEEKSRLKVVESVEGDRMRKMGLSGCGCLHKPLSTENGMEPRVFEKVYRVHNIDFRIIMTEPASDTELATTSRRPLPAGAHGRLLKRTGKREVTGEFLRSVSSDLIDGRWHCVR